MKKITIFLILLCLMVTGCGKNSVSNVTNNILKKYDKSSGYILNGDLEINNNDDVYNYSVTAAFDKKGDNYKITLKNKANDFKQIILKNNDGVFLLTPSLNKSFKFSSKWPNNNSQIYLFDTLIKDIKRDNEKKFEFKNNKYIYRTKVNYPNNSKISKQKIIFDNRYNLKMVSVYDSDNKVCMNLTVNKLSLSPKFKKNYFDFDEDVIVNDDNVKKKSDNTTTKETMSIDDVIYPLFLPSGTKLIDEKKIDKDNGQRVIMTYDGEKSFLLVEETLDVLNELTIIPSSGEPFQLLDTIGVMTDNSLSWTSGNMEYYLVSEVMDKDELIEIAQSVVGISSIK